MRVCAVYRILNTVTGESYVGGTINVEGRWRKHRSRLRAGKHCNRKMQASWNKYGESAFVVEILEKCDRSQLRTVEKCEIAKLDSCKKGFNSTPLGAGPDYETRAKIVANNRAAVNVSGLIADARSDEGRRRRSEIMRRLNAEGRCGGHNAWKSR